MAAPRKIRKTKPREADHRPPMLGLMVIYHQPGHGLVDAVMAHVTAVHADDVADLVVFAPGAQSQPKMAVPHGLDEDDPEAPYWEWPT